MSSHHKPREPWIDRWWLPLLILFGLVFVLCLTLYRPQHEWSNLRRPPVTSQTASAQRA